MERIVIIGAGQGGQQLAASLRQEGFAGEILLLGDEPGLPYQRPPLSKAYMADGDAAALVLKPEAFYTRAAITLCPATRVTAIDRAAARVETACGQRLAYDHLVLATGAQNLVPPLPGVGLPGVMGLRSLADAAALRAALPGTRHAVVIGGGFIGLEFAAMARAAGVAVTVIEAAPRLMARAVSEATSAAFAALHRAMGTTLCLGQPAAAVLTGPEGRAGGVQLADGTGIAGDLVLLAAGVRPDLGLATAAGLACGNGIALDGQLVTSDPAISALGDVAAFPDPWEEGAGRIRLESVQAAVDHARHIARRLVRGPGPAYAALPWFWSDQGRHRLQIAGLGRAGDATWLLPAAAGALPPVARLRDGRIAAVETVDAPALHMAARRLIGQPVARLEAAGGDLRAAAQQGAVAAQ